MIVTTIVNHIAMTTLIGLCDPIHFYQEYCYHGNVPLLFLVFFLNLMSFLDLLEHLYSLIVETWNAIFIHGLII